MSFPGSSALVGRAAEVSALVTAVGDAGTHAVLIAGEAGIGKSRLMGEFTGRLDPGSLVVVGRCPELGTGGVAFAPFLAVLRGLVRQLGVAAVAELLPPRPALANWLPQLAVHTGGAAVEADRIRLFGEILTVLEQLALARPVVVILEDLHWADDASRDLLTFLVANLTDADALMVGTYRPGEAGPLRGLVAELRRNPGVRVLDLAPLTRHEVGRQLAALLGREPEPRLITKAFERSGGNPLFVEALGQSPEELPAELSDLLLGFQSGLAPDAYATVRLAAVIGSPVRHELLAATADLPPGELHRALRELIDRHLLLPTDTGYEFRHVLIRQAIHDDLLPVERTRLHARVVAALRAETVLPTADTLAELAYHSHAAGDLVTALTATWSAASMAPPTHPERLRLLEQLLTLWDRVPTPESLVPTTKLAILDQIVEVALATGATERGLAAADTALTLLDPSGEGAVDAGEFEPERVARLYRRRAYLRATTGAGPGKDLVRALELLPVEPPSAERAEALVQSAAARIFRGDAVGSAADARAALAIAQRLGVDALVARAHAHLGLAGAAAAEVAAASAAAETAAVGRVSATGAATAATSAASRAVVTRPSEIDWALAHFAQAHRAAAGAGDARVVVDVATWESALLVAAGRYEAAIAAVRQGLRAAHESFRFGESAPILYVKWAQALAALGRWGEARAVVDEAQFGELPPLSRAAMMLCFARISLAEGDSGAARDAAEEVARLLGDSRWAAQYRLELVALRCALALEAGAEEVAAADLAGLFADPNGAATLFAHPHEAWPLVVLAARTAGAPAELLALGDALPTASPVDSAHRAVFTARLTGSAARWLAAATAWRAIERPYDTAIALLGVAESAAAEGNRPQSASALWELIEIATRLGAVPLRRAAEAVSERARIPLADPAGQPSKAQGGNASGSFGLTPRELDVLRLVAKGLSNRGLAAELFISANTAGVHVSRILTKLGVASRTEAAAFAHQHGLLGESAERD
ncbi:helix-turn-helix transcriptional regulator [Nocardia sp. CDC160]|uniref:helix-turn-helix transcriptional regulator n=1 Tax=Nocardia sp. CDC160 TaxID=3112166 RepID=UPI002DBD91D0|nr:AAA family ATPase [Nocardia sp. CDC160]MEC3918927.1 AAA family ATPase [Nocardia sp. CDC160]